MFGKVRFQIDSFALFIFLFNLVRRYLAVAGWIPSGGKGKVAAFLYPRYFYANSKHSSVLSPFFFPFFSLLLVSFFYVARPIATTSCATQRIRIRNYTLSRIVTHDRDVIRRCRCVYRDSRIRKFLASAVDHGLANVLSVCSIDKSNDRRRMTFLFAFELEVFRAR